MEVATLVAAPVEPLSGLFSGKKKVPSLGGILLTSREKLMCWFDADNSEQTSIYMSIEAVASCRDGKVESVY